DGSGVVRKDSAREVEGRDGRKPRKNRGAGPRASRKWQAPGGGFPEVEKVEAGWAEREPINQGRGVDLSVRAGRRQPMMVAGFHLIWTAYGWWLPNDPRGSESHEIRVEPIADLGELHHGRKAVQPSGREIRAFYDQARGVLMHPLLTFDDEDI